jgi:hypothetical protein
MMSENRRILSVRVERRADDRTGIGDYLGRYSAKPLCSWAIDRAARGDGQPNEYRYFNPTLSGEQTGNPESPEEDYKRAEAYERGEWHYVAVIAVAQVQTTHHGVIQTIKSGGLYGLESDCEEATFVEVGDEETAALAMELLAIGFRVDQIEAAILAKEDK